MHRLSTDTTGSLEVVPTTPVPASQAPPSRHVASAAATVTPPAPPSAFAPPSVPSLQVTGPPSNAVETPRSVMSASTDELNDDDGDVNFSTIDSLAKTRRRRRAEAKSGAVHYAHSSPQIPFKAQTIYQVLRRNHILTYFQSISPTTIAKPEIETENLLPGDLYIHYNSTTSDSQKNMRGQLWVWPKIGQSGW